MKNKKSYSKLLEELLIVQAKQMTHMEKKMRCISENYLLIRYKFSEAVMDFNREMLSDPNRHDLIGKGMYPIRGVDLNRILDSIVMQTMNDWGETESSLQDGGEE